MKVSHYLLVIDRAGALEIFVVANKSPPTVRNNLALYDIGIFWHKVLGVFFFVKYHIE